MAKDDSPQAEDWLLVLLIFAPGAIYGGAQSRYSTTTTFTLIFAFSRSVWWWPTETLTKGWKTTRKNPAYGRHWLSRRVRTIAMCKKLIKIFGSDLEHLPVFKALRGHNPRVEHLPRVDNPCVQSGPTPQFSGSMSRAHKLGHAWTIHESNPEQLLVSKAPRVGGGGN